MTLAPDVIPTPCLERDVEHLGCTDLRREPVLDLAGRARAQLVHLRSESPPTLAVLARLVDWAAGSLPGHSDVVLSAAPEVLAELLDPPIGDGERWPSRRVLLRLEGPTLAALGPSPSDIVRELARRGARFAVDLDPNGRVDVDVLAAADALVVDLEAVDRGALPRLLRSARAAAPRARVVAVEVHRHLALRYARLLGATWAAGRFVTAPDDLGAERSVLPAASSFALLLELQDPALTVARLADLIGADPVLAYRVLSMVNGGVGGARERVESLHQAVVLLGIEQIRNLAVLVALAAGPRATPELVRLAATRARFATLVAPPTLPRGAAALAGLLSVLDALLGRSLAELVEELRLGPALAAALVDRSGPLGAVLDRVLAYEAGVAERSEELVVAAVAAVRWADTVGSAAFVG
jgi:EAL and modified HD-GYP domain-containing signal transduction protein